MLVVNNKLVAEADVDENTVLPDDEVYYLRDMAVRAIMCVDLDVGGVDFLTDDISRPYKEIGGAIVEVNAAPGFRMHVAPSEGTLRDVSGKIIEMLFPPSALTQIPIAAITGINGKTTTSRMLDHIMKASGHTVGMTSTGGVYVDGKLSVKGDMTGPASAQIVLQDPTVDFAVMETARGGLLRSGLGYQSSDVAVCLNVTSDHLGLGGIDTVEQLAMVKRVVVTIVVVLLGYWMGSYFIGARIWLAARGELPSSLVAVLLAVILGVMCAALMTSVPMRQIRLPTLLVPTEAPLARHLAANNQSICQPCLQHHWHGD